VLRVQEWVERRAYLPQVRASDQRDCGRAGQGEQRRGGTEQPWRFDGVGGRGAVVTVHLQQ
jgi:hypothetical protein